MSGVLPFVWSGDHPPDGSLLIIWLPGRSGMVSVLCGVLVLKTSIVSVASSSIVVSGWVAEVGPGSSLPRVPLSGFLGFRGFRFMVGLPPPVMADALVSLPFGLIPRRLSRTGQFLCLDSCASLQLMHCRGSSSGWSAVGWSVFAHFPQRGDWQLASRCFSESHFLQYEMGGLSTKGDMWHERPRM